MIRITVNDCCNMKQICMLYTDKVFSLDRALKNFNVGMSRELLIYS